LNNLWDLKRGFIWTKLFSFRAFGDFGKFHRKHLWCLCEHVIGRPWWERHQWRRCMAPKKGDMFLFCSIVTLALQMRIHSYYWKDSIGSHKSMMDTSSCKNSLELRKTSLYTSLCKNEHLNHICWEGSAHPHKAKVGQIHVASNFYQRDFGNSVV
jgi:hypothetical protein